MTADDKNAHGSGRGRFLFLGCAAQPGFHWPSPVW
jgi:hypothetical protein